MKTDYLDVVQFHASPIKQALEEHGALDALLELREARKVCFIGMSGTLRRLRIFGQQNKLRADRSKGRETWA